MHGARPKKDSRQIKAASGLTFFDTNIIIYADDNSYPEKQDRAIRLYTDHRRAGTALVSLQVLQEYFAAATRKLALPPDVAQQKVEILARGRVVRIEETDIIAAIQLHRLTKISFWDALIVRAAQCGGAAVLYSEDLQPGATLAGVRVINPFAAIREPH